ncbi:MAG TPA: hypothetical protein VF424_01365, partial [Vicinamibacterales bacterium]
WHFMDFMMLVLRLAVLFQPLRVFVPLAVAFGAVGLLKAIYDVISFFPRVRPQDLESFFVQPLLSTTAVLFLVVGLQLLVLGLVADAVLRRFAQYQVPVPSRAVTVATPAPMSGQAVARFK